MSSLMKVFKVVEVDVPNLGSLIREARLNDRRSLKEICDSVGMTTQNWYRIEKGQQSLPINQLRAIEKVLNQDFGVTFD